MPGDLSACPSSSSTRVKGQVLVKKLGYSPIQGEWYALKIGSGMEAERLSVQAVKERRKVFSGEHENVIAALQMVASTYRNRGQWDAAEELEVQVMENRKKRLGEDHPDTLVSMANPVLVHHHQGA